MGTIQEKRDGLILPGTRQQLRDPIDDRREIGVVGDPHARFVARERLDRRALDGLRATPA